LPGIFFVPLSWFDWDLLLHLFVHIRILSHFWLDGWCFLGGGYLDLDPFNLFLISDG
jgi:hypothetical protein